MNSIYKNVIELLVAHPHGFDFPQHKNMGKVIVPEILAYMDFVETPYLQDDGKPCAAEMIRPLLVKCINNKDGSMIIDILKESLKRKDLPPAYMEKEVAEAFAEAGVEMYFTPRDTPLIKVPGHYRNGKGYPSDAVAVQKGIGFINGIADPSLSKGTRKRHIKELLNIFNVYEHLQRKILTEGMGAEWVANFTKKCSFDQFKDLLDTVVKGPSVKKELLTMKEETKYAQPVKPYVRFQGTGHHCVGPQKHSDDLKEEQRLFMDIFRSMEPVDDVINELIAFIHRSKFQKQLCVIINTGKFVVPNFHSELDELQRGYAVEKLLVTHLTYRTISQVTTRYKEASRDPVKPKETPVEDKQEKVDMPNTKPSASVISILAKHLNVPEESIILLNAQELERSAPQDPVDALVAQWISLMGLGDVTEGDPLYTVLKDKALAHLKPKKPKVVVSDLTPSKQWSFSVGSTDQTPFCQVCVGICEDQINVARITESGSELIATLIGSESQAHLVAYNLQKNYGETLINEYIWELAKLMKLEIVYLS